MPAPRRTGELTVLVLAFALIALLTGVAFFLAPADSSPRTAGSSFSTRRDGAKAAFLVLKQLGHQIDRSYDPLAALPAGGRNTTLILAGPAERPSRQDVRALRTFVEEGGVLLAYGPSAAPFIPGARAPADVPAIEGEIREFSASLPTALSAQAEKVSARVVPASDLDDSFMTVFGSSREPAVVTARLGGGRIVWCLDDSPVTNTGLPRASNVRFLANAAATPGTRRILWDEHYHGQRRSMWSYFAGTPLPWAGAQFLLAAIAAFVAVGRRRGPIRARFAESRTSPLEFVDTMAALYERAGSERAAVEAARAQLRRRLTAAASLPRSTPDLALAKAAAWRLDLSEERLSAALRAAAEILRRGVQRADDAVPVVAELQELTNAAAEARTGRRLNREHR
jgi:hypothetical protein